MEQLKPPGVLNLEGNLSENYKEWIQGFEFYLTATGIEEKEGKVQVATFLHVAGIEARRVYNTFDIGADDKDKIDVLKAKFKDYCEPRKNLTYIRHVFFSRNQGQHETIDSYVTDLKNKAKPCEVEHLADGLIRDRIVCGIQNESCRARLLREADLTLVKTIDVCRAHEISSQQMKSLKTLEEHSVGAIGKGSKFKNKNDFHSKNQRSDNTDGKINCKNCGRTHARKSCPAFGKECHSSKKKNHFAKYCMSKQQKKKVHTVQYTLDDSDDELFIGTGKVDSVQKCDDWKETLTINGKNVEFKLDTGAQANIISKKLFHSSSMKNTTVDETSVRLVTYDGHRITPIGSTMLDCVFKNRKYKLKFFVVPNDSQPILSADACSKLGAIVRGRAVDTLLTKDDVKNEYSDIFKGLGTLPKKHHIEIDPSVPPVIHPPRKVPAALRDQVRSEIDRMVKLGVIAKQDEPTDWVHSMVIVRKPGKLRICIDPKDLNIAIEREHYHLESIEEIVERLPQATVFSRFDATHGFWQVHLDNQSSTIHRSEDTDIFDSHSELVLRQKSFQKQFVKCSQTCVVLNALSTIFSCGVKMMNNTIDAFVRCYSVVTK